MLTAVFAIAEAIIFIPTIKMQANETIRMVDIYNNGCTYWHD